MQRYDILGKLARGGTVTAKVIPSDTGVYVKYNDYLAERNRQNATSRSKSLILEEVACERSRQDEMWGEQNHNPEYWLSVLGEEFGEVCKAICENPGKVINPQYRMELIHTAAVAVSMIECYDRLMFRMKEENDYAKKV